MRAAKFLGVPPWDLAEAPVYWLHAAEQAQRAEGEASRKREERAGAARSRR